MTDQEQTAVSCPNCTKPAIKTGKVITCVHCDAKWRITKEGPVVDQVGPIEQLSKRLDALEMKLSGKPKPEEVEIIDDEKEIDPDEL